MKNIIYFFIAFLFGLGLDLAQMTNPQKVIGFLNITKDFDPSLMFVMVGGILVFSSFYFLNKKRIKPFLAEKFFLKHHSVFDKKMITGSVLFGTGWGIAGYCPGPIIASLGKFQFPSLIALIGMLSGMFLYWFLFDRKTN